LDVSFPLLDVPSALLALQVGLTDQDDIVVLVYQALHKLAIAKPNEVAQVLDQFPQTMMVTGHTHAHTNTTHEKKTHRQFDGPFDIRCALSLFCVCPFFRVLPQDGIKDQLKKAKSSAASGSPASAPASAAAPSPSAGGGDLSSGERARDVLRTAMRCMLALAAMPTVKQCPQFVELFQRVLKTALLARIIEEIKQEGQQ